MWMVDNNDNGKESTDDPLFSRKLRPIMPRPISSCAAKSIPFFTMSTPSCFCIQNHNNLPIWNHPVGCVSDYGVKREIETVPLVSTRWNPTSEQLQALEEMYKRGTRTPSAEQIQQIAERLRRFGKIEGKNVFYWFQNHKARERQKKRRQLELLAGKKVHHLQTTSETKQTGLSRRYFEIENHKKLTTPSNCSTPSVEDSVSMHGSVIAERKKLDTIVWTQLDQKELQTAKNVSTSTYRWWKLDLSNSGQEENTIKHFNDDDHDNIIESSVITENQTTLELFPTTTTTTGTVDLSNLINHHHHHEEETHDHHVSIGNYYKSRPNQFIEFLPTKNIY